MPNASRPLAEAVSICAPAPASPFSPMPRGRSSSAVVTRWRRSRPSFQLTSVLPGWSAFRQAISPGGHRSARGQIPVDERLVDPGRELRVELRRERLRPVGLGHVHVTDFLAGKGLLGAGPADPLENRPFYLRFEQRDARPVRLSVLQCNDGYIKAVP